MKTKTDSLLDVLRSYPGGRGLGKLIADCGFSRASVYAFAKGTHARTPYDIIRAVAEAFRKAKARPIGKAVSENRLVDLWNKARRRRKR